MPLGYVIGVVQLADVEQRTRAAKWTLRDHFHWLLRDVRVLEEPVSCRGQQGLWSLPVGVELAVEAQL